jgi:hypothetical protein
MMKAFQQEKQARARGNKLQIQYHWKCNPKNHINWIKSMQKVLKLIEAKRQEHIVALD